MTKKQALLKSLALEIISLNEAIKEQEQVLAEKKKALADILPNEGITLKDETDETKVIQAKWTDKLTKTLQKALVEQNHSIVLTDADYKQTPSRYVSVSKVNA